MNKCRFFSISFHLLTALVLLLSACTPGGETATPSPTSPAATPSPTVAPPPTALTVCLGQEPASLFPLNNPSSAARSVLAALYDGPIDALSYQYQPVILESLPTLENGDAQLFPLKVYVGDEVVDVDGVPVTLSAGIRIRPAGCRSAACAITYDGRSEVEMEQMTVTFRLLPGLLWSDGQPLTASDSVYSYDVVKANRNSYLAARTQSYEAADELTVQWWGRPGYIDPDYLANFFMPLPAHLWSGIPADQLADSEAASLNPLGWGPYVIDEWDRGNAIILVKNPHYFRLSEGLPRIDVLTFRFTPDPEEAISALLAGECDVIDPSVPLDGQVALLLSLEEQGQLDAHFTTTPVMEQLVFGIQPAVYDNGNNPDYDRPDFFGDVRVRRAVEQCIDRQQIIDTVLFGLSSVPGSYVPLEHPFNGLRPEANPYDPAAANALLEEAGWRDLDGVPSTTRQAWGIPRIANGTLFTVEVLTSGAQQRVQVSQLIAASLAQCGIQVELTYLSQEELYNAGPDGPLFGRIFELAEYAMGTTGVEPPCEWFTSVEIPNEANRWLGTNLSGYSSPDFDAACAAARQSLPGETAYKQAFGQAQALFAQDLPSLPLYWRVKVAASRPQVCGFSLDPSALSGMWNVENLQTGKNCTP